MEMDKRNLFQLLVELSFFNGVEEETQKFYSKPFLMRSRPRNKKRKLSGEYTGLRGLLFIRDGNYFLRFWWQTISKALCANMTASWVTGLRLPGLIHATPDNRARGWEG